MKNLQAVADRFAVGLSFLCAVHCLAVPVLLVLVPSLVALQLDNEAFHKWMVFVVVPVSIFGLTLGCKQHNRFRVLVFGLVGILLMIAALALEALVGEWGEKLLTLTGAALVAWGHILNFRLCQEHTDCDCPEHQ